jgi:hypothetical protein
MKAVCGVVVMLVLALAVQAASAAPAWGGNCLSCHGQLLPQTLSVFDYDTMADPDESLTGAPDRGILPVFQAGRGQVRSMSLGLSGLAEGDRYAVQLRRLRVPGVEVGGRLYYAADCDWAEWGEQAGYYSEPEVGYTWGDGPVQFSYEIGVLPAAEYDYYDLVFAVAGRLEPEGELFYWEEHFYLQVFNVVPGDLNCDGEVNSFDIDPFTQALIDPAGYAASFPRCSLLNADCNADGVVNVFDIDPFVALLTGD